MMEFGSCSCFKQISTQLILEKDLGMDQDFAEVTLLVCPLCAAHWLRYFYEHEAFTASGRWYLGAVTNEQAVNLTAAGAKATIDSLDWVYFGGSYFNGKSGRFSRNT